MYKFGGQPFVRDFLTKNFKGSFDSVFGERHAKTIIYATAGSIMGVRRIFYYSGKICLFKRLL